VPANCKCSNYFGMPWTPQLSGLLFINTDAVTSDFPAAPSLLRDLNEFANRVAIRATRPERISITYHCLPSWSGGRTIGSAALHMKAR
jgi:hypothetical protein